MGVKVLKSIPPSRSSKIELLVADIKEIIANEIEFCELTNFPYSEKTSITDINFKIKRIFKSEFYKKTGKFKDIPTPFVLTKTKDNNGAYHYYGVFSVATWKKQIKDAQEEE